MWRTMIQYLKGHSMAERRKMHVIIITAAFCTSLPIVNISAYKSRRRDQQLARWNCSNFLVIDEFSAFILLYSWSFDTLYTSVRVVEVHKAAMASLPLWGKRLSPKMTIKNDATHYIVFSHQDLSPEPGRHLFQKTCPSLAAIPLRVFWGLGIIIKNQPGCSGLT